MPTDIKPKQRPSTNSRMREKVLVGLSYDLAERQLRDGTATSQVQLHFLKMGSGSEELARIKVAHENELLKAKIEVLESQQRSEEQYRAALEAMRKYSGNISEEVYDD